MIIPVVWAVKFGDAVGAIAGAVRAVGRGARRVARWRPYKAL